MAKTDPKTRMQNRAGPRSDGISLVELMIGVILVISIITAVVGVVLRQTQLAKVDGEVHLALMATRNAFEELRALPLSQLAAYHGVGFDVPGPAGQPNGLKAVEGDADGLPGEYSVVLDNTDGTNEIYRVAVTIRWSGAQKNMQFRMLSLISERNN